MRTWSRRIFWGKITGFGMAISSLLGGLAMLPYEIGQSSLIISPAYKEKIALAGIGATFALRFLRETFGLPNHEGGARSRRKTRKKPRKKPQKKTTRKSRKKTSP